MTWRGPVVLVLLLALGAGAGFGASWALGETAVGTGEAAPIVAEPTLPVDPKPDLLPDPDFPALAPGIELVEQRVGTGDFGLALERPAGWRFTTNSLTEWQWRPPDFQTFGYYMRVEQVISNRRSIAWTLDRRIDELVEDEQSVQIKSQGGGRLHYTYVTNNHLRHGFLTWLDLTGSDNAQVEIAVTGRAADVPGMSELIGRVAESMRLGRKDPGDDAP
ncbi:hypothetical protein L2K70_00160 [Nocardioides KLBMP 9356]|uniref:Uncharacterized protein n=1 Tax=Nocardioides potassii TaxID=2911371 RepID=A0ABS9H458_9ACTN|nr:hypothetical protein [Nocardioides potassii]MCF6376012.1 hypothetical protein [Nocardioides potassii]